MASIHNLSGNAAEDSPHEIVVIDTETRYRSVDAGELHTMRVWCAALARRHGRNLSRPRREDGDGTTAGELAAWIDSRVRTSPCVWVYAHNLSFDLTVSRLPLHLIDLGWVITQHNLASDAPWAMLRKGNKTMRLVDSHSVMPAPLDAIAASMGGSKVPLPGQDEDDAAWRLRCAVDVDLTIRALCACMDWWDENKCGHWSITGAQCAWNSYRHRTVARKGGPPVVPRGPRDGAYTMSGDGHVVIHPDPDARAFERSTLYQGRRDAWIAGDAGRGTFAELDIVRAHLTVACELPLPCRRGVAFESLPLDSPFLDQPYIGLIARVIVDTDTARYPVRDGGRILHPTGRFSTVLAGPEILDARERGELVEIGAGCFYRLSYHMQPWALWVESLLADAGQSLPGPVRIMVKGWSRACFGKWAARTSHQVMTGTCPETDWSAVHGTDAATGCPATVLYMRGTMSITVRDLEADDAFPAVLSYVQSYTRVGLSRALDTLGDGVVVTCSTDSVLIRLDGGGGQGVGGDGRAMGRTRANALALETCAWLGDRTFPFRWALKKIGTNVSVLSPQHVTMDDERKYSGVPRGASNLGDGAFAFLTWPKLGRQIEAGSRAGFLREHRTVRFEVPLIPRYVAADGCAISPAVDVGDDGTLVHLPPAAGGCPAHGSAWADRQFPGLVGGYRSRIPTVPATP